MLSNVEQKLAEAFVWGARRASPDLRKRVMSSPVKGAIAQGIFAGMARSFDRTKGADLDAVIRWEVGEVGDPPVVRELVIRDGKARVVKDSGEPARTTVGLDHATLLELSAGILNAPQAYLSGRLRMKGDVMLAQRLTTLFAVPGGPPKAKPKPPTPSPG